MEIIYINIDKMFYLLDDNKYIILYLFFLNNPQKIIFLFFLK